MNLQVFSFFISCGVMGTGTLVHSLGSMNLSLMISLMILYKNTKSCRGTHSRKRRGRNCCCKGKAFIWIVQGIWGKNVQGECKKASLLVFFCRAAAIFMQKVWKWRRFLTDVGCWRYKMRHLQTKVGHLHTILGGSEIGCNFAAFLSFAPEIVRNGVYNC